MAIGVDVDQYYTFPEAAPSLLTSAVENVEAAVYRAVRAFIEGRLEGGVWVGKAGNDGVGLAPFHEWEDRVPEACRAAVEEARQGLASGAARTGWGR